jgi:excisionase family DNA binding protein
MTEPPLTYSVEEAASLLAVSRNMAYELIHQGRLPHIKLGRRLLISRAALHKFVGPPPEERATAEPLASRHREERERPEEVTYVVTIRRVETPPSSSAVHARA